MNRSALIIGGCKGIGRAISRRLAADGFDIIATARKSGPDSEQTMRDVRACGRAFTFLPVDVRAAEQPALAPYLEGSLLPEVIVYNAGIAQDALFVFMDRDQWGSVLDTNINGFYNTVQPFLFGLIRRKRGRIITISSASGQIGQGGQVNYSASKAALIGATRALAREVAKKNILVNAVAPGVIETDMTRDLPKELLLKVIPQARYGSPDEVAGAVSFLAGPDATYITGQVLAVNGGLVI